MTEGRDPYGTPADAPALVGDFIFHAAERNADRVALEIDGTTRTYAQLDDRSDRVSANLAQLGLGVSDRVAVMMDNDVANVDAWFGICKAGAIEVPINTANRGLLLSWILSQSGARALICDARYAERVLEVVEDLPDLAHIIVHGTADVPAAWPPRIALHDPTVLYEDAPTWRPERAPSDPTVILYTSGTTGPSKGVVLSHTMNLTAARHNAWLCRYGPEDLLYTVFPLFHINAKYTSVMAAMAANASLIMDTKFSASTFMDTCRARGITAFNYQGALLTMLMKQPVRTDDSDNPVTRAFGAPAPVEIWEAFEQRYGLQLIEVYGMTETSISLQNTMDDTRVGTCGRPAPHYDVEVHDQDDNPCPPGVPGEIVVRPRYPDVMITAYHGMPEETLAAFRNLWFHTGDRARVDEDGYFTFIDRMKDAVRRRGENISSFEIEGVVNTHEDVLESAAYGVPSDLSEEEVMVAVVTREGRDLPPLELVEFCNSRMAYFAVPRYVRFVLELPKTPSQRIQKFKLRQDGVTTDTWDREAAGYVVRR